MSLDLCSEMRWQKIKNVIYLCQGNIEKRQRLIKTEARKRWLFENDTSESKKGW